MVEHGSEAEKALEARVHALRAELSRAEAELSAVRREAAPVRCVRARDDAAWRDSVERALEQALARLRSHVEGSPLAVVEWTADQRVVAWSAGAERLFGWSAREVRGRRLEDVGLFAPEDRNALTRLEREACGGDPARSVDVLRNVRKDGEAVWCEWYRSVLRDREGGVRSVLAQVLDVTERQRTLAALRASQAAAAERAAELEAVFATVPFPVLVFDGAGRPTRVNPAACEVLGMNPTALDAAAFAAHVTGRLRMRLRGGAALSPAELPVSRALRGEPVRGVIVELEDAGGHTRSMSVTATPLHEGERLAGAVVSWFELTDRLAAEEQARRSEVLYRSTAKSIPDGGVCVVDRELRYLAVEGALLATLGLSRAELEGRTVGEVFSGETRDRIELHFERAIAGETHTQESVLGGRTLLTHYGPLLGPEGSLGALALVFDITERKRAEEALRDSEQREAALRQAAESAVRAKDEFLAMLGHELRNPLAPILTAVQLLRLRAGDAFSRERAIIERQAQHMMRLVDDLLDVSRITRGKVTLRRRRVDVGDAVARAVEMASPLLEERAHRLDLSVPAGLAVDGDEDRLTQVFANLLTNAARYTPSAGRVEVTATAAGDRVRVAVRDEGVGIPPGLLPRLFETFVQGERRLDRGEGGLGLGLALVKRLTELHGGRVEARSDGPGKGSEFVVEFPAWRCPAAAGGPEDDRVARVVPVAPAGLRVLVVDDNSDAAELLAEGLRLSGHRVAVAFDGPQALRVAAPLVPQVALLDIGLPVMDGYELGRRLRERYAECRLVAVTGYGQAADLARTRSEGFLAHVVKPIDLEGIRALLRQLSGAAEPEGPSPSPLA